MIDGTGAAIIGGSLGLATIVVRLLERVLDNRKNGAGAVGFTERDREKLHEAGATLSELGRTMEKQTQILDRMDLAERDRIRETAEFRAKISAAVEKDGGP